MACHDQIVCVGGAGLLVDTLHPGLFLLKFAKRDYRGLSSVRETSLLSNLSIPGIILLFSVTDDISSSLFSQNSNFDKLNGSVYSQVQYL